MPNCDWYGTQHDHVPILDWLFEEKECRIFELSSDYEKPLKEFKSTEEVIKEFDREYENGKKWNTVYLQIYVLDSGPEFKPQKVSLNPEKCNGATYRYNAEGWGLIQFYLGTLSEGSIRESHTNHNSRNRAEKWSSICEDMGSPDAWDFEMIKRFSSRLNRKIRKEAIAKVSSNAVLSEAMRIWKSGNTLGPYDFSKHKDLIRFK